MTRPDRMPIDPDVDADEDARHHPGTDLFARPPVSKWPRFRPGVVAAVFIGGCAGGLVRYAATDHWTSSEWALPWATFTVNVAGAFVLALLVVVATEVLGPSTYLRPLVGTGFCGALTTFSSIVVSVDRMVAHGHADVAAAYLLLTVGCGLVAGLAGVVLGRLLATRRPRRARREAAS